MMRCDLYALHSVHLCPNIESHGTIASNNTREFINLLCTTVATTWALALIEYYFQRMRATNNQIPAMPNMIDLFINLAASHLAKCAKWITFIEFANEPVTSRSRHNSQTFVTSRVLLCACQVLDNTLFVAHSAALRFRWVGFFLSLRNIHAPQHNLQAQPTRARFCAHTCIGNASQLNFGRIIRKPLAFDVYQFHYWYTLYTSYKWFRAKSPLPQDMTHVTQYELH